MRWEIYYVHPQSGPTLLSGGCPAPYSGENLRTNIHTNRDRITENKSVVSLAGAALDFIYILTVGDRL